MGLLKGIFGPSKEEVWQQLCREIDARFVEGEFWNGDKVQAHINEWVVTLDTHTVPSGRTPVTYTRMRAPYINKDGFRFKIYRKGLFSELGKKLGMKDIEVGHLDFDRDYVIQGNDPGKVRSLFANPKIRELIQVQPDIELEVVDDEGWGGAEFPEGVDELLFHVYGDIRDVARLKSLYELFAATLNHLCHIGSAYEDDPELAL